MRGLRELRPYERLAVTDLVLWLHRNVTRYFHAVETVIDGHWQAWDRIVAVTDADLPLDDHNQLHILGQTLSTLDRAVRQGFQLHAERRMLAEDARDLWAKRRRATVTRIEARLGSATS